MMKTLEVCPSLFPTEDLDTQTVWPVTDYFTIFN